MNRYFLRRKTKYPLIFILLFSIISSYYLFEEKLSKKNSNKLKALYGNARIIEIHDGDTVTIELEGAVYRARLIGIDAPEMGQKPWGERAKGHLLKLIKKAKEVRIETDIKKFDKYNRLLIYLFTEDGIFVNEQLLRDGYAVLLTIPPDIKYVNRFINAQKEAREHKRGIWGKEGLKEMPEEYRKKHRYER
ncbi:MAG: thermonuclease family protein [Thermodesulfovibrionales bacterium]